MGRLAALGWIAGAALTHTRSELPSLGIAVCIAALMLAFAFVLQVCARGRSRPWAIALASIAVVAGCACAGTAYAAWFAQARLNDRLDPALEDKVTRLSFRVTGLSADRDGARRFEAQVIESPVPGVPERILVNWTPPMQWGAATDPGLAAAGKQLPEVLPGQVWRAALVLRRPHGTANPASFDYEGWMFSRNVRAIGKVRGEPVLLEDRPAANAESFVARARHVARAGMRQALGESRYGAVMIALAIGDQDGVLVEDWRIFGRTGITHLVSISGSHVTMLAAMGAWCAMLLWKRSRLGRLPACEWLPARLVGAIVAVVVAWAYCLLAGWGVPARRTFLMLAVAAFGLGARAPLAPTRIVCAAAALVVAADPWAPMATGFWLSFGAVAVLLGAGASAARIQEATTFAGRLRNVFAAAARLQWLITLAMLPVLAFMFQQASASSPLANAIAIPVITFIVTPLALATGLFSVIPGLGGAAAATGWAGHQALAWTLVPVEWLAHVSWATLDVAQLPWPVLLVAMLGVAWALQPPGVPARWAGWCLVVPALTWQPPRPQEGDWRLVALDVGQGSAIVVSTRNSDTLFDTGPKVGKADAGERIVAPVLRAFGIRSLAALVVSHPDLDHAGGLHGVLSAIPVDKAYASFDLASWLGRRTIAHGEAGRLHTPGAFVPCVRGTGWTTDGVTFEFLHPAQAHAGTDAKTDAQTGAKTDAKTGAKTDVKTDVKIDAKIDAKTGAKPGATNARSCVLRIAGKHHSALLTGDIGVRQEREVIAVGRAAADLIVVAHHGSRSSSSSEFTTASRASHALIQVGRHNRFGHPDPDVLKRWDAAGATLWRSDLHGAVIAQSGVGGLDVQAQRHTQHRYWHGQ